MALRIKTIAQLVLLALALELNAQGATQREVKPEVRRVVPNTLRLHVPSFTLTFLYAVFTGMTPSNLVRFDAPILRVGLGLSRRLGEGSSSSDLGWRKQTIMMIALIKKRKKLLSARKLKNKRSKSVSTRGQRTHG